MTVCVWEGGERVGVVSESVNDSTKTQVDFMQGHFLHSCTQGSNATGKYTRLNIIPCIVAIALYMYCMSVIIPCCELQLVVGF